jgi:hypothetical protein
MGTHRMWEKPMAGEQSQSMEGRCTCGAVRFRLKARPMFVHCCHCSWCQRETGSAFAVNAMIEASNVELLSGTVRKTTLPSASGKGQVFSRCPECGVTLWSNYAGAGETVHFIRAGTLENPAIAPPDIHIFTSTKQPWVVLPQGVPAVPEFYRRSEYWPPGSVARYNAARTAG